VDSGGRVAVAGPVTLAAPFPADLAVTLSDVVLRDPSLYQTTVDGRIRIAGALSGGAAITGTVALGRTELQIPSSTVGFLGELPDVRHIGADAAVATTLARAGLTPAGAERDGRGGSGGPAYPLDLMLRAPDRVFVRGRGLDAELGGELHIVGTTAEVIPSGELRLLRGRLDILQQRFALTEGSATLQGDFQPFLRLVAQTRARSGTEVSIVVEGPADDPTVRFTSTPELPQDEVLARLLFGRDLSTITPLQAVQLAAAVGTLAGRGGGGVIAGLREGLGLDDFDISTDAEGNTALAIGKYLGENLYTDVTVTQAETAINLNFDLTPDIRATGTVTTTGETTLGIYFERDY
jgi:autotransporter translocation and assembly factor TamB